MFLSRVGRKTEIASQLCYLQFSLCCSIQAQSKPNQSVHNSHCQLSPSTWQSPAYLSYTLNSVPSFDMVMRPLICPLLRSCPRSSRESSTHPDSWPPGPDVEMEEPGLFASFVHLVCCLLLAVICVEESGSLKCSAG